MVFIGIIISIILFSIIVLVHEWGHFKSARFFGVKVEEFGLGIPPRAKKLFIDKKGTLFSLNWLPLGGFVKLTGENLNSYLLYDENKKIYKNDDLEEAIKSDKDIFFKNGKKVTILEKQEILKGLKDNKASYNLMNKKARQQSIIILAGVFMNFLLAFFVFFFLFLFGVKPITINTTEVGQNLDLKLFPSLKKSIEIGLLEKNNGFLVKPLSGSLAEKSGIKNHSVILKIDNQNVKDIESFVEKIKSKSGKEILLSGYDLNLNYKKGCDCGEKENFELKIKVPKNGKIGIYIGENIKVNKEFSYKYNLLNSTKYAFLETKNQIIFTFEGISYLFKKVFFPKTETDRKEAIEGISGPIGIVNIITLSISAGFVFLLVLGAIISINLGVFNLLPIPALDGGRFLFIIINSFLGKFFGKKLFSENAEAIIHFLFFIILIALSIFIGYNDISKIINK